MRLSSTFLTATFLVCGAAAAHEGGYGHRCQDNDHGHSCGQEERDNHHGKNHHHNDGCQCSDDHHGNSDCQDHDGSGPGDDDGQEGEGQPVGEGEGEHVGEGEGDGYPWHNGEGEGESQAEGEGEVSEGESESIPDAGSTASEGEGDANDAGQSISDGEGEHVAVAKPNNDFTAAGSSCGSCNSGGGSPVIWLMATVLGLFAIKRKIWPAAVLMLLFAHTAGATGLDNFDLTPNTQDILVTPDARVLPNLSMTGQLGVDYSHNPEVLRDQAGQRVGVLIENQLAFQGGAALGLGDVAEVGLMAPFAQLSGPNLNPTASFGDVRLLGKLKLFNTGDFALALREGISLPLSNLNNNLQPYIGDRLPTATTAVSFGYNNDHVRVGADLGFELRESQTLSNLPLTSALVYSVGLELPVVKDKLAVDGSIFGNSSILDPSFRNSPLEFAVGAKIYTGPMTLSGGVGGGIISGVGAPDARVFFAVGLDPFSLLPAPAPPVPAPAEPIPVVIRTPVPPAVVVVPAPLAQVRGNEIVILKPIFFAFDSDIILQKSEPVLLDVASVIQNHPDLKLITIEGHASSEGEHAHNQVLSERRAASVRRELIMLGVDPNRLRSVGYGSDRPLVSNSTAAGRETNRRVQFMIVERQ